jgi:hypothetical protein
MKKKVRKNSGREQGTVIHKVEHVLKTHHIAKPYYHGGKYHGKAMVCLMDKSQIIMEDIKNMLVNVHDGFQGNALNQTELCSQQEIIEWCDKFKDLLKVFDSMFSQAHAFSGMFDPEQTEHLKKSVETAMGLWRGTGQSISPKVHAIEDHLVEQILRLQGIGDLCEDFVEQLHQERIIEEVQSKCTKSREIASIQQCRKEHKRLNPDVISKIAEIKKCSKRTCRHVDTESGAEMFLEISAKLDKKKKSRELKDQICTAALEETAKTNGAYLKSGLQCNLDEAKLKLMNTQSSSNALP